jgi:hypothetical protein
VATGLDGDLLAQITQLSSTLWVTLTWMQQYVITGHN